MWQTYGVENMNGYFNFVSNTGSEAKDLKRTFANLGLEAISWPTPHRSRTWCVRGPLAVLELAKAAVWPSEYSA